MKFITIEGNIGAGKSTLLPKLAEALGYTYLLEPVDTDSTFQTLLKAFTKNPSCVYARNAFQEYMTEQRFNLLTGLEEGNYLIERSLLSDLVFTHACMSNYENTAADAAHHMDCYKHLISRLLEYPKMDLCLYLQTTPEVAYQRMLGRGRKEELGTPLSYIKDLSLFHDAVLPQVCRKAGTKFVTVDWDIPRSAESIIKELEDNNIIL